MVTDEPSWNRVKNEARSTCDWSQKSHHGIGLKTEARSTCVWSKKSHHGIELKTEARNKN
jgi:hypothetical protein